MRPCFIAGSVEKTFPPYRDLLYQKDPTHSNLLLQKISWAGGNCSSFEHAARALEVLAGIRLDPAQVARITQRVGKELSTFSNRYPENQETLEKIGETCHGAVVSVDGGRVQTRAENQGRGVHLPQWRETRVAHLQITKSQTHIEDPHPQLPEAFADQNHVRALVAQLNTSARTQKDIPITLPKKEKTVKAPKDNVLVKSSLATIGTTEEFAPLVRNEATRLQMEKCPKKAFLADGAQANWNIHDKFFSQYHPVLDFVHLVEHLFAVAGAICKTPLHAWKLYLEMIQLAWAGKPTEILAQLKKQQVRIGSPTKGLPENHPKRSLERCIKYISENQNRINYPEMRKLGLPVSSCRVESLIKQINQRVKASDKFWIIPNLKAVLQIRTAEISTTGRWDDFWSLRRAA